MELPRCPRFLSGMHAIARASMREETSHGICRVCRPTCYPLQAVARDGCEKEKYNCMGCKRHTNVHITLSRSYAGCLVYRAMSLERYKRQQGSGRPTVEMDQERR
jgi:hypothetical protein